MLNVKQQRFVAEYLIDLNATAAYKRAGYKGMGNSAEVCASQLLSNPKVAKAVQEAMNKRSEELQIDANYVLKTIKDTIERCSQAVPVTEKDGTTSGEYKFDAAAVLRGAELLGKHLKMFTDKTEVTGKDGGPIEAVTRVELVAMNGNGKN